MMMLHVANTVLQLISLGLLLWIVSTLRKGHKLMATNAEAIEALTAQVAAVSGTVGSAVTFIAGLEQQMRDKAHDSTAILELADTLSASRDSLAAAIDNDPVTPPAEIV